MNTDDDDSRWPSWDEPPAENETSYEARMAHIEAVQTRYERMLMSLPHVVGVSIGMAQKDGEYTEDLALIVMVDEKIPLAQLAESAMVPQMIDGVRIDVQQTGPFSTDYNADFISDGL